MKKLMYCLLGMMLSNTVFAQSPSIKVDFCFDGRKINLNNNFDLSFISGTDTVKATVKDSSIVVPRAVMHQKATMVFHYQDYQLVFNNIPITWNESLPVWYIEVDKKPIDKEKYWMIEDWRKIKVVYSLRNGIGSQITEYRYKNL